MNTLLLTPNSSVKSSTTTTTTTTTATTMDDGDWSETQDNNNSCYFPGCRKDTNCNCDICLASINATLDLIQRSSLTKLSTSKPPPRSPVTFDPSFPDAAMSTPRFSRPRRVEVSPPLNFTARMNFHEKVKRKKRELGFGVVLMRSVMVLSLILAAEFGFSWVVFRVLQPNLSPDIVRNLGEKSWVLQDLNERMKYLNKEMQGLVGVKVSNRSSVDSVWEIIQDGLLLNSRCTLYKSAAEEVSIWGWPLQTAGLLTTEFSSRSFTILSGRVTEWSNGKLKYSIRKANSSWKQGKWSSSVVNFDRNTWILEYKMSSMIQNARLVSAALEFLKFRMKREVQNMKQEFWMLSAFGNHYSGFTEDSFRIPT